MEQNTERSTSLGFKPLTEGLGLNHFADGLPYAPAHARKKPTVQFNYPPMAQTPIGTESARRMVERFDTETVERAPRQTQTSESPAPAPQVEAQLETAGFFRRIFAYVLDLVFSTAMFAVIVWGSFAINGFDLSRLLAERRGAQIYGPLALLYAVVYLGYFLIQETTWRRTLGKAVMGIRINSHSGFATLGRTACFFVSAIPLGIGLFWCLFDSRRRCWHDVITDCEVVLR